MFMKLTNSEKEEFKRLQTAAVEDVYHKGLHDSKEEMMKISRIQVH